VKTSLQLLLCITALIGAACWFGSRALDEVVFSQKITQGICSLSCFAAAAEVFRRYVSQRMRELVKEMGEATGMTTSEMKSWLGAPTVTEKFPNGVLRLTWRTYHTTHIADFAAGRCFAFYVGDEPAK
jgi:hypothetical protein